MNKIKVGDTFLESTSVIAQTFKVNSLGEIGTRQGGVSNNFDFPMTKLNREALGFPEDLNQVERTPYTRIDAALYDGNKYVSSGYLRIKEISRETIRATFFSDNSGWFARAKDKTLKDLYLADLNHDWTGANIRASFSHTAADGYIYPLIDYGTLANVDLVTYNFPVEVWYPAVYVKRIFEQIFDEAQYEVDGELLDLWEFNNMILPFTASKFNNSEQSVIDNTVTNTFDTQQIFFGDADKKLTPNAITALITGTHTVDFSVNVTGNTLASGESIRFELYDTSAVLVELLVVIGDGDTGIFTRRLDVALDTADNDYYVQMTFVNVVDPQVSATIDTDGSFITLTPPIEKQPGDEVQISTIMPDIKQSDFVKYICNLFGAFPVTDRVQRKVSFNLFKNIKERQDEALDWSDKIDVGSDISIDFTELVGDYGNKSVFNYLEEEDDDELTTYREQNGAGFGEGVLDINNENISNKKEIYEAPFGATINILSVSNTLYMPQINWLNESFEKEFEPLPRVLLITPPITISELSGGTGALTRVDGTFITELPFAWFAKAPYTATTNAYTQSLSFGDITFTSEVEGTLARYWAEYNEVLSNMKYIKADFALTAKDLADVDFMLPVYIDYFKAYFYINSINEFTGAQDLTEVELIKIP